MRLNTVERVLMNDPVRAVIQRQVEAACFERPGGRWEGRTVLGIDCGRGIGVGIILERFPAARVYALDLDPAMVSRVRGRLPEYRVHHEAPFIADAAIIPVDTAGVADHTPRGQVRVRRRQYRVPDRRACA